MGPKPRTPENNDLFRQRLDELVNLSHPLVQLAQHIDWSVFEDGWGGFSITSRSPCDQTPLGSWTAVSTTHFCAV